jgi:hypothetical protein
MKMKILFSFSLFLLFSSSLYSYPDEYLTAYANRGVIEAIEETFRNCEGSDLYINKYQLNEEEINMLGNWGFDGLVCPFPPERKYGPGLAITFYPNRYFRIYKENENVGQIRYIVGEWKVDNYKLQLMFIAKIIINDLSIKDKYARYTVDYLGDNTFYTIFSVPAYKIAYVNDIPFDWSELPSNLLFLLDFRNDDAPRSRLLFDTLGDPPGNIQPDSKYGKLLLEPKKSKEYFIDLLDVW